MWPIKQWSIEQLSVAAFFYNPSLEVARAQWQGANGAEKTAAQRPNPTLTLSPGYDFTATSLGANPWLPGGTIDVPIETMGKRGLRKKQAHLVAESSRLALVQTAWSIRSAVRSNIFNLASWREKKSLLEQQIDVQKKIIDSLKVRMDAGAATSTELTLVQVAFHKMRLDYADARQQERDTLFNLADTIGVPASAIELLDFAVTDLDFPIDISGVSIESVSDIGLKNSIDILEALTDYNSSEAALHLQIARQYPDIHFGPNYQYNQGDHQFLLGISAELPVFNQNQGPIAEAIAKRQELATRFYQVQSHAINEIDHAYQTYHSAQENLKGIQSLADAQQGLANAIQSQAEAGAADKLEVLNSRLELLAGKMLQMDARMKVFQAFGALEDSMQKPIEILKSAIINQSPRPAAWGKTP